MRKHQKYRQLLLPKIETALTERRLLRIPYRDRQMHKEVLEELVNSSLQMPSARLRRDPHLYEKAGTNKENQKRKEGHGRKENSERKEKLELYVPGRYYQLKKEMDLDEIFVKRNQVSDWSRKSALYPPKQSQQRIRIARIGRGESMSKTEEVRVREELSGWEQIEDGNIEIIHDQFMINS